MSKIRIYCWPESDMDQLAEARNGEGFRPGLGQEGVCKHYESFSETYDEVGWINRIVRFSTPALFS